MHRAPKAMQDGPATEAITPQPAKPMGGTAAKRAINEPSSMSESTDADRRTETELVRAAVENGASLLFAAAVAENRHGMPAEKVAYALDHDRDLARHCRGGHFMSALWDGDLQTAVAHADSANTELLESIDLLEGVEVSR